MTFTMYRKSDSCNTEPMTRVEYHQAIKVSRQLLHDLGQFMARSCSWPMPDGSKCGSVWGCLREPHWFRNQYVILELTPFRDGCTRGILHITFTKSKRTVRMITGTSI